jgi:hypothetical protein
VHGPPMRAAQVGAGQRRPLPTADAGGVVRARCLSVGLDVPVAKTVRIGLVLEDYNQIIACTRDGA